MSDIKKNSTYTFVYNTNRKIVDWSREEDELLISQVSINQRKNWRKTSNVLNQPLINCYHRFSKLVLQEVDPALQEKFYDMSKLRQAIINGSVGMPLNEKIYFVLLYNRFKGNLEHISLYTGIPLDSVKKTSFELEKKHVIYEDYISKLGITTSLIESNFYKKRFMTFKGVRLLLKLKQYQNNLQNTFSCIFNLQKELNITIN